jgi:hypothetical protein
MQFALQCKGQHQRQRQNQHHHQRQHQRHTIILSTISNSSTGAIFNVCAGTSSSDAMRFALQRKRKCKDELPRPMKPTRSL